MFFARLVCLFSLTSLAASYLTPRNGIKWTDCSKNVPESTGTFNGSVLDLTKLPSTLHCGQIDVPMDYSKPFCDSNKITLGLAMYRPTHSNGALFFNPGGTDPGVVVAWEMALNLTETFSEFLDYDLLVMDVRGTFSSNPLNVSLETFSGLLGEYPTNQTAFNVVKEASSKVIRSWIDSSSPPGIIEHVGTREVVQDYESIRRALGYEKINFLGASYGSFRAVQYAATFPNRVNNFVLDAVVPHGRSLFDQAQDDISAINRLILRADAYCQNDISCPFHTEGQGSVPKALHKVLSTAKQSPYLIRPCVNSTQCYPYATDLDIQTVMAGNLQGSPDFPAILAGISNALSGDGTFFMNGPPPLEAVVAMPLLCNDYGVVPLAVVPVISSMLTLIEYERTFEYFQHSLQEGLKNDKTGIGMTQTWQIQLWCSGWPFQTLSSQPLPINQKMVLVTSDFDGSAPTEWATAEWGRAPNSALIVRHGDDHVSFPLIDQVSTKLTTEFLRSGALPVGQSSPSVSVYGPRTIRGPISNPYLVPTGASAGDVDSGAEVEIPF